MGIIKEGSAMVEKEPFREAFRLPRGMIKSAGFKDDPRYRGGRLRRPILEGDIVLRPDPSKFILRIIAWAVLLWIFLEDATSTAYSLPFIAFIVVDIIFAVPKFLFERTTLRPDGVERSLLLNKTFLPWEDFHRISRDSLGVGFRVKRPWGIWMDDYNLLFSRLYYSSASIDRVVSLFKDDLSGSPAHAAYDGESLIDIGG
jgi:hypothetical protein